MCFTIKLADRRSFNDILLCHLDKNSNKLRCDETFARTLHVTLIVSRKRDSRYFIAAYCTNGTRRRAFQTKIISVQDAKRLKCL